MKKTKTLGWIASAIMAVACAWSPSAQAAGDIWSIQPVTHAEDATVVDRDLTDSKAAPLKAGDVIKIRMRMLNRNYTNTWVNATARNPWGFKFVGVGSEAMATSFYPKLGLWVSGKLKYAELEGLPELATPAGSQKGYFTDIIFKYTVEAGDLALPLKLANPTGTGPVDFNEDISGQYFIKNGRGLAYNESWALVDAQDTQASFTFVAIDGTLQPFMSDMTPPQPNRYWDFSNPAVFIQAIDFDDVYADPDTKVWRKVSAGTTSASPIDPAVTIEGGSAETMDLYVWTANSSIAKVVAGGQVVSTRPQTNKDNNGNTFTVNVGTLRVPAHATSVSFKIEGQDQQAGQKVDVYLSSTPTNVYDTAGMMVTNFITRTVQVVTPPPPYVSVAFANGAASTVVADGAYDAYKTVLTVSLSQTYSSDVTVDVTPSIINNPSGDPWNYMGLSQYDRNDVYMQKTTRVTIPAGSKTADLPNLYVYALGADQWTRDLTNGILFRASIADPTARAFYTGTFVDATLHITANKPVVTMPDAPYTRVQGGVETDFNIRVSDSFRSLANVYDVYWSDAGDTLVKIATGVAPVDGVITVSHKYLSGGQFNSKVQVVNASGLKSEMCDFQVTVLAPRKIFGEFENHVGKVFGEGETAEVKVKLNTTFDLADIGYVFLVPKNEASSNLVQSLYFEDAGVPILNGDQEASIPVTMNLLDGNKDSSMLMYDFVIRTQNSLTQGSEVMGFASQTLTLSVTNVIPSVKSVYMGGIWGVEDGEVIEGEAAVGVRKVFTYEPEVNEVDADLEADPTNTGKAFLAKWTFYDGAGFTTNVFGSPYSSEVPYTFTTAGKQKVTVRLQDKDLRAEGQMKFGPTFTFYVNVTETPTIAVSSQSGSLVFNEGDTGSSRGLLNVDLSIAPTAPIEVELSVSRLGPGTDITYPLPVLNNYKIRYPRGQKHGSVFLKEMDGTSSTAASGFNIAARVITTDMNSEGIRFCDLYLPDESFNIYVENEAPVLIMPVTDTNEMITAVGKTETVRWKASEVCPADVAAGIHVEVLTSEKGTVASFTTNVLTGEVNFSFTGQGGGKWVQVQVYDKDGGYSDTGRLYYRIDPAKSVYLYPQGPFAGGGQSALSQAYLSADGVGAGRVWADIGGNVVQSGFKQTWTYAKGFGTAFISGVGYRNGDIDDGRLTGGVAVDVSGAKYDRQRQPYQYTSEYDSFLYAWIIDTADEGANFTGSAMIAPQVGYDTREKAFNLPADEQDAESYGDTMIEILFSREWRKMDNMGDINQDGIPDAYATKVYNGGTFYQVVGSNTDGGAAAGGGGAGADAVDTSDLKNAWGYNGDNDFLPSANNYGNPVRPAVPGWGPGMPFIAGYEIRGLHEGLNDSRVSEPDFSPAEEMALLTDYLAAGNTKGPDAATTLTNAYNWAKTTHWNLECRTDPTMADTDGDGLDDGFEYFFWYYAKAGVFVDGVWERLTGSRYNYGTPGRGVTISSEEIAEQFNPTIAYPKKNSPITGSAGRDFDNDGLTDLEEYALGTNPVHWDSDGDGVNDYYEILNGMNPLDSTDGAGNPDGDFMAYCELPSRYTVVKVLDTGIDGKQAPVEKIFALTEELGEGKQTPGDAQTVWQVKTAGLNPEIYYLVSEPVCVEDALGLKYLSEPTKGWKQLKTSTEPKAPVYLGEEVTLPAGTAFAEVANASESVTELNLEFSGGLRLFRYGGDDNGVWVPKSIDGQTCEKFLVKDPQTQKSAPGPRTLVVLNYELDAQVALIHHQVYQYHKFDPRTAWNMDEFGFVSGRWHKADLAETEGEGETGRAVNTRPYTSRDEFLLASYRFEVESVTNGSDERIEARAHYDRTDYVGGVEAGATFLNDYYSRVTTVASNPQDTQVDVGDNISPMSTNETALALRVFNRYGADTDDDGVPDGWELYVNMEPTSSKDDKDALKVKEPFDSDGLTPAEEFAGTDSCNAYTNVPSIYKNHPGMAKGWWNKFFPTDPWDNDTDGDGLSDAAEGNAWKGNFYVGRTSYEYNHTFIYNEDKKDERLLDMKTKCFRGGGLNPCTVDTDMDLLPDPWEMEFAGILISMEGVDKTGVVTGESLKLVLRGDSLENGQPVAEYIAGGMDGTFAGDAFTDGLSNDGAGSGTARDMDFDHDGLQNYQEYLVQALRHLRYDDGETPLMGRYLVWKEGFGTPVGIDPNVPSMGFIPMQTWDGDAFFKTCVAAGYRGNNSRFDYGRMGYFARPPKSWDRLSQNSGGDKCARYAEKGYRVMLRPNALTAESLADHGDGTVNVYHATGYASTDPRRWDSDDDGMDDYYELFHGLNPLLGSVANPLEGSFTTSTPTSGNDAGATVAISNLKYDRIASIYGGRLTSWKNAWTFFDTGRTTAPEFDAIKYPWMIGTAECDADGDGLRNSEEALTPNLTTPATTHTDPTPLWLTDSSSPNKASFVAQYYKFDPYWGASADLTRCWGRDTFIGTVGSADGYNGEYMFAFEENEGFDTDHDFAKDADELTKRVAPTSDPLVASDPARRQAMYFPGQESAVVSSFGTQQRPNANEYDLLRQFSVEAWICPERVDVDQVILERVADYGASTLSNNQSIVRANFRLGVNADGRIYGEFEGTSVDAGTAQVVGQIIQAGKWTHVALTYDGNELRLYMNGEAAPVAHTSGLGIIPANGVTLMLSETKGNSFPLVPNGYATVPCAFIMGAHALTGDAIKLSENSTWANYNGFFKGWIDEVRVWDGARTGAEIEENYKKAFTQDDARENRASVYSKWVLGSRRNNTLNAQTLPCELLQHYNFSTLPGDVNAADVAQEPTGFTKGVLDNVRVNDQLVDVRCGWWSALPVKSLVYNNYALVPWIPNTVAHLPALDGTVLDSNYWSEHLGGVSPASESGVSKFDFPNTANPYPYWTYYMDRAYRSMRWTQLGAASNSVFAAFSQLNAFDLRSGFVGTSDLLPLGSAFPKRVSTFWDGNGPADASLLAADDEDADGLPDWWERLYGDAAQISWDTEINYNGKSMLASEAYQRDLAKGMLTGGTVNNAFSVMVGNVDIDGDGLPDWWTKLNGLVGADSLRGGVLGDYDNDQLSNFAEFWMDQEESFPSGNFPSLKPTAMRTNLDEGQLVPDYFKRVGSVYLGELFGDHDFMEDWWERLYPASYTSMFKYDPHEDADGDGWSTYAECRYSQWSTLLTADAVARWLDGGDLISAPVRGYPQPALGVKLSYYGNQAIGQAPIIVRASSGRTQEQDALFQIEASSESAVGQTSYLGAYRKDAVVHGHLNPGAIIPGSVVIKRVALSSDKVYQWSYAPYDISYQAAKGMGYGTLAEFTEQVRLYPWARIVNSTLAWEVVGETQADVDGHFGSIVYSVASNVIATAGAEIGRIDFRTGEYTLDMAKFAAASGKSATELDATVFCVDYSSRATGDYPQTFYLSTPMSGRVREGVNYITAFADLDGDGVWTPGEPYGAATPFGTHVGWWKTDVSIELTDTAPQAFRLDLAKAMVNNSFDTLKTLNDRDVNGQAYGKSRPVDDENVGTNMPAATATRVRMRIVRSAISQVSRLNGAPVRLATYPLVDQEVNPILNPIISEANVLQTGALDLDWGTVVAAGASLGVTAPNLTSAWYRVTIGDELVTDANNNSLAMMFENIFEPAAVGNQTKAVPLAPMGSVAAGSPTFTWAHTNAIGKSYPAFNLRIWDAKGTKVIYDSGAQRAPARNSKGVYSWTAPVYAGSMLADGTIFSGVSNYQWSVSMLDAKFTVPNANETKVPFRMECGGTGGGQSEYGSIKVAVKYMGPGQVSTTKPAGLIRVQAFTTPDFTGVPVGEGYVTDATDLASETKLTVNATIKGLAPDTYYVMAFLDSNANGVRDEQESWGYANYVGSELQSVYNPKEVILMRGSTKIPQVTLYLEDTDRENDGFPDVYELDQKKDLAPAMGDTFFTKVNPNLAATLPDNWGNIPELPTAFRMLARNTRKAPQMVALMTNASAPQDVTTVSISSFDLANGAEIEVKNQTTASGSDLIITSPTATVALYVVASDTLDFAHATSAKVKDLTIQSNAQTTIAVSADEIQAALKANGLDQAAFIKVKLVQD